MLVAVILLPLSVFLFRGLFCCCFLFVFFKSSDHYWHSHQQRCIYLQDFKTRRGVWVWMSNPEQL